MPVVDGEEVKKKSRTDWVFWSTAVLISMGRNHPGYIRYLFNVIPYEVNPGVPQNYPQYDSIRGLESAP